MKSEKTKMGRQCHCPDCRHELVSSDCPALKEYEELEQKYRECMRSLDSAHAAFDYAEKLERRWQRILEWAETADRSPQSWAELDRIIEEETRDD